MNRVQKMGEWAKQHPELVYGWAAMTWEGPPDLRDHQTSMHMTPLVPAWRVIELEEQIAAHNKSTDGFRNAFYEIAALLGTHVPQMHSPKDVYETQMKPRIAALVIRKVL